MTAADPWIEPATSDQKSQKPETAGRSRPSALVILYVAAVVIAMLGWLLALFELLKVAVLRLLD